MKDKLGNNLRAARARVELTQAELAQKVGFSRRTINAVENDVFIPSTLLALKLAAVLDRKVEELFFIHPNDG